MEQTKRTKKIAANTLYTIAGALVLNGVLQLFVYPRLASNLGADANGTMLYIMAFVNILGPSIGQALNNSRLVLRRDMDVSNGDYNTAVLLFGAIGAVGAMIVARATLLEGSAAGGGGAAVALSFLLFPVLMLLTDFRYYGDVEYRLTLNYKKYFIYYTATGIGYLAGYVLYLVTGVWYFIFLAGEAFAFIYVASTGSIYKKFFARSAYFRTVLLRGGLLVLSYFVTNLTLNIDRLYLKWALGGEAVTVYYVVSLIGKTLVLFIAPINTIIISYLTKDNVRLGRKKFLKFAVIGIAASFVFFLLCLVVTPIFIRLFYPSLAESAAPLITIVTATQILAMLSAYLFIIVLTFTGVKWQLGLQIAHLCVLMALVALMTPQGGITGFSTGVLIANAIRVAAVLVLGVVKAGKDGSVSI